MSIGDAVSLGAGVALIFAVTWLIDSTLREEYRLARAAGVPAVLAVPAVVVAALLNGC